MDERTNLKSNRHRKIMNILSFEIERKKCNLDKCLTVTVSTITISCIIGYFIYLAVK